MQILNTPSEFIDLCHFLSRSTHGFIAVDTEFVRKKTYWPEWALLQLATPDNVYIIDVTTLTKKDFTAFKNLLLQRSMLKVFHACRQDLEIFFHELGILPNSIFDCQVAAHICGFSEWIGMAKLAQQLLKIEVVKTEQHTNWLSRPLSSRQIAYASIEVQIIQQLYHALCQKLDHLGRWEWLYSEQSYLTRPQTYQQDGNDLWRRIKTPEKMKPSKRGLLQAICCWREKKAQQLNYNRAQVMSNDLMIKTINLQAKDLFELADQAPEIPVEYLEEILELLLNFKERSFHTYPSLQSSLPRPPFLTDAFTKIAHLRRQTADRLGIDEQLLAKDEAIKDFISGIDVVFDKGWRLEIFGKEAKEILNQYQDAYKPHTD